MIGEKLEGGRRLDTETGLLITIKLNENHENR